MMHAVRYGPTKTAVRYHEYVSLLRHLVRRNKYEAKRCYQALIYDRKATSRASKLQLKVYAAALIPGKLFVLPI